MYTTLLPRLVMVLYSSPQPRLLPIWREKTPSPLFLTSARVQNPAACSTHLCSRPGKQLNCHESVKLYHLGLFGVFLCLSTTTFVCLALRSRCRCPSLKKLLLCSDLIATSVEINRSLLVSLSGSQLTLHTRDPL